MVAPASALPGGKNEYYKDEEELPVRARRRAARGIQGDRRCRTDRADRRRLPALHVREDGAADVARANTANGRSFASTRSITRCAASRRNASRYHICWGSWNGPHAFDVPMKDIVDLMLQVNAGALSIRGRQSAPRARMDGVGEREAAGRQDADPRLRQPCHQYRRASRTGGAALMRLAKLVGRENVMAGTDCGFAQSPFAKRVHDRSCGRSCARFAKARGSRASNCGDARRRKSSRFWNQCVVSRAVLRDSETLEGVHAMAQPQLLPAAELAKRGDLTTFPNESAAYRNGARNPACGRDRTPPPHRARCRNATRVAARR